MERFFGSTDSRELVQTTANGAAKANTLGFLPDVTESCWVVPERTGSLSPRWPVDYDTPPDSRSSMRGPPEPLPITGHRSKPRIPAGDLPPLGQFTPAYESGQTRRPQFHVFEAAFRDLQIQQTQTLQVFAENINVKVNKVMDLVSASFKASNWRFEKFEKHVGSRFADLEERLWDASTERQAQLSSLARCQDGVEFSTEVTTSGQERNEMLVVLSSVCNDIEALRCYHKQNVRHIDALRTDGQSAFAKLQLQSDKCGSLESMIGHLAGDIQYLVGQLEKVNSPGDIEPSRCDHDAFLGDMGTIQLDTDPNPEAESRLQVGIDKSSHRDCEDGTSDDARSKLNSPARYCDGRPVETQIEDQLGALQIELQSGLSEVRSDAKVACPAIANATVERRCDATPLLEQQGGACEMFTIQMEANATSGSESQDTRNEELGQAMQQINCHNGSVICHSGTVVAPVTQSVRFGSQAFTINVEDDICAI